MEWQALVSFIECIFPMYLVEYWIKNNCVHFRISEFDTPTQVIISNSYIPIEMIRVCFFFV